MRTVNKLRHGGIMANYQCTAACRHCLYACSPERSGGYISKETAEEICALLREGGCQSVHIGGGEPFLDFNGLAELVHTVSKTGITVDYIETNAYWATDERQIEKRLRVLARAGADTLCISIDPFHAEYVPVSRPLFLAEACRRSGFGHFLWQDRFLPVLSRVDSGITHSRAELERLISPDYILETTRSYGVNMGGRAVNIEAEYATPKPIGSFTDSNPCGGLLSGDHFHVDLYGRYIPPGCTGITIPLNEAVRGIPDGKYPAFEALLSGGVAGLLQYAQALGFDADKECPSRCALCFNIRRWLCENAPSPELDAEHYTESLKYYD